MFAGQGLAGIWTFFLALLGTAELYAQERNLWYAISHEGERLGSNHIQVTRVVDGQLKFVTETRIPLSFLGQRQEILYSGEYHTSEELRPISLRSEMTTMSGTSAAYGTLVGDTLTITSTKDGEETSKTWRVDPTYPVLFDHCVGEWLAKLPPEATPKTLQQIELHDDSTWHISTVTATLSPTVTEPMRWRIEPEDPAQSGIIVVAGDGFERERLFETGVRLERCSRDEAARIEPRDQSGREVLIFELDRPIPHPRRLTDLTVELRWNDIPFDEFELEDARQRLVEHSQENGSFRAVVNISKPAPIEGETGYPVREGGFEPFLAETDFIKPNHAAIQDTASKVVQGHSTALEAVQALSTWVHEYIVAALIVETLTGPQVLARKTGKCTEYSTLFASLARSVGIPTRIAFGERMFGGKWGGHMWNEVYVGRWIPVDATANEVGESFALLKFLHSDTMVETQPLRWKLVESLELSIQAFALRDSALAGLYETGVDGSVYTNVDYQCRLSAPSSDWKLIDTAETGSAMIRFEIPEAEEVKIHFVVFDLPAGTSPKALANSRFGLFEPSYDDFEVTANEAIDVQGAIGHTTCFGGFPKGSEVEGCVTEVVWTHESSGFLLNMIATRADHDEYLADFEDLLGHFEFLSPGDR
jgi:transglutaminase-like putative cysteine protease